MRIGVLRTGAVGVVRVYRASRRYAPPHRALGVVAASGFLYCYLIRRGRSWSDNERNAARHFAWQVYLGLRLGYAGAAAVGNAHEAGSPTPADSVRDTANNAAARDWFRGHEEEVRRETGRIVGPVDLSRLVTRGRDLYREGRMYARGTAEHPHEGFDG